MSEYLGGRDLRQLTRKAMQSHGGGSLSDAFEEVYSVVFSLLIGLAVAVGAMQMLNAGLRSGTAQAALDPWWLAVVVAIAMIGGAVGLAGRLGPLGMGGGQAAWWLPTPADRRGLLRPRLIAITGITLGVGIASGGLTGLLAGEQGAGALLSGAVGGCGALAAVLIVARGQVAGSGRSLPPAVVIGDVLLVAAPVVAVVVAVLRPAVVSVPSAPMLAVAAAVFAVASVVLGLLTDRNIDSISGAQLRARGAATAYAAGAVTSLDTRELSRALTITSERDSRRRSLSFERIRGPVQAIVVADILVTWRSRRHFIQIVAAAMVPVAVTLSGWGSWTSLIAIVVAGYIAALGTAEGARRADMAPVLDRSFPIAANRIRRVRFIWPAAVMSVWVGVSVGLWAYLARAGSGVELLLWVLLGMVAGPALAAGALRGAYRPPTDWSQPLISNPMGAPIPPGLFSTFSKGPDVAFLCLVPLVIAMVSTLGPATLMSWQLAATFIAAAIATHVRDPKNGWMAQARQQAAEQASAKK